MYVVQCRKIIPIFFAEGRSHYSRYSPLFIDDSLDLHHEFSERQAKKSQERVNMLIDYIKGIGSAFKSSAPQKMHNIVTNEELSRYDVDCLMNTIKFGEEQYGQYTSALRDCWTNQ